jgi:O-antigen/teichoic acid export membrane protein
MDFIHEEANDARNIFSRLRRRDFSGNTGIAIKNSSYQLMTNLVAKVGSLIFAAIIARMLLPELFGLYSLALGTIIFISAFAELGLDSAMIAFVSKSLNLKKEEKAKSYFKFLMKYKLILVGVISIILLGSAYFISNNYYNKPIFFALLAGGIYLPFASLSRFIETTYLANNNFKIPFIKEIFFQIIRLISIPLLIFALMRMNFSAPLLIALLISSLGICYGISLLYLIIKSKKNLPFLKSKKKNLTKEEKLRIKKFTLPLTVTVLSGVFFGYIDTLMLGRFVSGEYLGYYGAAFSLIGSAIVILGFAATAIFPIFSRMHGKSLNKAFKKVMGFSFIISLAGALFTFIFAKYIIIIVYGLNFIPATIFLKLFSILLISGTLNAIYNSYFVSQEKTKIFAKILVGTTILNIILNYVLITQGLKIGMNEAVIGACIATIISRIVYLISFEVFRRK